MLTPGEYKTVHSKILKYADDIGWTIVSRAEAKIRRNFGNGLTDAERASKASLYFEDSLYSKVREFNSKYRETEGALVGELRRLQTNIYGNRDFLAYLRNQKTYFDPEEKRELNLKLIDYENFNNIYEVTDEFYIHNGRYGNREDIVFLINGIPVLVIECKNATKDEAIALGIDQIRRYHTETPEFFVPEMIFTVTEAIGLSYGVTWNTIRRNIFNWKDEQRGQLEAKIKSFCSIPHILDLLREFIVFAEKDEELHKYILKQHQIAAIQKVVNRCHDTERMRGLIWHTQGSGKTFTMIKAAELLFKAPQSNKPTILLMIDRNELEDQLLRNLASLGLNNVAHADSILELVKLLKNDYRGIIVTTIQKFRKMPAGVNERSNIYILIDEAHRTTGGDLGNYLLAGLPNATYIGFTGTPIDKTTHGEGTFKIFGVDDPKGYLHKYSIQESIEDGTTLPLFYAVAPNDMLVPTETMEKEFWSLVETEGISDIAELNKILERAVNIKNFLKGDNRVDKVAHYVAEHYTQNVEPLGYKAFLVAVDRPACAKYKEALDRYLPPEYSAVVYTGTNNDSPILKKYHIDDKKEKQIRRDFAKFDTLPKILIVTEKLLTGYDAPLLYAMYLDKPMRDHTLLQAIARVNRPYENEAEEMVKPHGFVLDFVGIFDKLEKALSFDSEEINAIIKDMKLLKDSFKIKMDEKVPEYLSLVQGNFDDKDVDFLIEHFRDKDIKKEFFREYKEIEMLYEIISPDIFLRPYLEDYATLSAIYKVVRNAYTKKVYVDRAFQKKTNELVQKHISTGSIEVVNDFVELNSETIELIKNKKGGDNSKIINLIKSIESKAEEESDDPFLIAMADRAMFVRAQYEDRQISTKDALEELYKEIKNNEVRKKEQAEKGFDALTLFVHCTLLNAGLENPDNIISRIKEAFIEFPNWQNTDAELRELRNRVTFTIFSEMDDLDQVAEIVSILFEKLEEIYKDR